MNDLRNSAAIRRANPVVMLVVGALIGAMLAAIGRQPPVSTDVATGQTGSASATTVATAGPDGVADPGSPEASAGGTGGVAAGAGGAGTPSGTGGQTPVGGGGEGGVTPTAEACAAVQQPGVQGVTEDKIKIGFAVPDLGVLAALIEVGDIEKYTRDVLTSLEAEGRLPVCGRSIDPVFRTYDVLDPAQSRSACAGFADEDKVFAVMALFAFAAADCVAIEKGLVMFDAGQALTEPSYAKTPLLFAAQPPIERQLRAYSSWVVEDGIAPGKKTGVYYVRNGPGGSAPPGDAVEKNLIAELKRLGHPVDVVVATDGCGAYACADPNDNLALQRFQSEGVEVVYMMNYKATLIQRAEAQGYRPRWVLLGTAMASDATTGNVPPANFDGSLGMLFEHVGEELAGVPLSAEEQRCWGWWESQGNERPPSRDAATGQSLRQVCDQLDILTRALAGAGGNLTSQTMVTGMEGIRDLPMAYQATLSFLPGKHWGAASNLIVRWHADCECWKATGGFRPLYGR